MVLKQAPLLLNSTGGVPIISLYRPTGLFDQYQIKFHAHTSIVEVFKDKVLTVDNMSKKIFTEADTIISAIGRISVKNKEFE